MITAAEVFKKHTGNSISQEEYIAMIEFAKACCIEQAKVISEKANPKRIDYEENLKGVDIWEDGKYKPTYLVVVDKDSILNAFDLDNIK